MFHDLKNMWNVSTEGYIKFLNTKWSKPLKLPNWSWVVYFIVSVPFVQIYISLMSTSRIKCSQYFSAIVGTQVLCGNAARYLGVSLGVKLEWKDHKKQADEPIKSKMMKP